MYSNKVNQSIIVRGKRAVPLINAGIPLRKGLMSESALGRIIKLLKWNWSKRLKYVSWCLKEFKLANWHDAQVAFNTFGKRMNLHFCWDNWILLHGYDVMDECFFFRSVFNPRLTQNSSRLFFYYSRRSKATEGIVEKQLREFWFKRGFKTLQKKHECIRL